MANNNHHDYHLERLMNLLADSVLTLSDDAILAEVNESGSNPNEEAERTRFVLCRASHAFENLNRRLSNQGHSLNSKFWRRGAGEYHNECLKCGSPVSFAVATGEVRGRAFHTSCAESSQFGVAKGGNIS